VQPKRIIPRVTKRLPSWVALVGAAVAAPVAAHHGQASYDREKTVSVMGTVTQFEFVNPHVLIHVSVPQADGKTLEWAGELTSPNRLARLALGDVKWHKELLRPGDQITLTGNPARNGAPALFLTKVLDASGKPLIGGGP
jgi:hypothetical protein